MREKIKSIAIFVIAALSATLFFGCKEVRESRDQNKRTVLLGSFHYELYMMEGALANPTAEYFKQSRAIKEIPTKIENIFLADLTSGKFIFRSMAEAEAGEFLMVWDCGDYTLTCTSGGAVREGTDGPK